jgi:two-component system, NtrC family, response regulator AtoC
MTDIPTSLAVLVETHEEPFVVLDAEARFLAVNSAFAEIFALDGATLVGQSCWPIYISQRSTPTSPAPMHIQHQEFFANSGQSYTEVRTHRLASGQAVLVRARGVAIHGADGALYLGESLLPIGGQRASAETFSQKMCGASDAFLRLLLRLDKAAECHAPVLLHGETGTGKELAAEYVHMRSVRNGRPFVIADCTVLTAELFESELFGHERGAFTGSTSEKKGLFELANGGTLFLDEMGELPLSLQAKLLRALDYGTYRRVGGTKTLNADVRIICATNRNLMAMVKAGSFRPDLYYRIVVFPVPMPPLRERPDDIPMLARTLLAQVGEQMGKRYEITEDALVKLKDYWYPGNIRELRNVLQLATSLSISPTLRAEDIQFPEVAPELPEFADDMATALEAAELTEPAVSTSFPSLDAVEFQYVAQLLGRFGGDKRKVAEHMGISERTLYRKLQRNKGSES